MDAISRRLENQYADDNSDTGIRVMPLHEDAVGKLRPVLLLLFAAVGFLAFHRLRQRGEPVARARRDSLARNFHPRCDGREPSTV